MANLNQFYKGEAITIIAPKSGEKLVGNYTADGVYDAVNGVYAGMRAYPDDLNLENGDVSKIFPFSVATTEEYDGKLFTISGSNSLDMVEGSYTVELIYGRGDRERVIVKYAHAFTIVGSAYKRKDTSNN